MVASHGGIKLSCNLHPSLAPRLAIIELFHIVRQQALVIALAIAQHLVVKGEYFIEM